MLALCVLRMMHSGMLWFRPVRNMITSSTYLQTLSHSVCVRVCLQCYCDLEVFFISSKCMFRKTSLISYIKFHVGS